MAHLPLPLQPTAVTTVVVGLCGCAIEAYQPPAGTRPTMSRMDAHWACHSEVASRINLTGTGLLGGAVAGAIAAPERQRIYDECMARNGWVKG